MKSFTVGASAPNYDHEVGRGIVPGPSVVAAPRGLRFPCGYWRSDESSLVAGYSTPVAGEHGHEIGVDPLSLPEQRLALGAFMYETDFLVDMARSWVELVHLELDSVEADRVKGVAEHQPGDLGPETPPEMVPRSQKDAKAAGAVGGIEVVEDDLADPVAGRSLDDGQIEPVGVIGSGPVPRPQLLQLQHQGRALVVAGTRRHAHRSITRCARG